ncbi:MAG: TFIIB-type zinc ribbon-containing protein [Fluviicola sp.]
MATERKCPKCQTWNTDVDYCTNCGEVLSPTIIEEQREKQREKRRYRPPTKFDKFIEKWQNSRFWMLRVLYRVVYTIGVIFFAIASFFAWIAASPNG